MPDLDSDIHLRLTRYLSGGCSAAEAVEVERWLAADVGRQHELDAMRQVWDASAGIPPTDRVNEMWRELLQQIHGREPLYSTAEAKPSAPVLVLRRAGPSIRAPWWRWPVGIAAAATVAFAVGYGTHEYRTERRSSSTIAANGEAPGSIVKEYRTARGQRGTVQLNDGTRIELGVASLLRVSPFTGSRRHVELVEGEGVFDVVHDAARPFTVRSSHAVIEDLGTRFSVRAYHGDAGVRVAVAEGKVALRPDRLKGDTSAVLLPGDLGTINDKGQTAIRRGVPLDAYFGWTSGRLVFDNVVLAEVAADLERWYDIEITIASPKLAERRVTLSMPLSSLTDALDAVTAPLGIVHTRHGSTVSLGVK